MCGAAIVNLAAIYRSKKTILGMGLGKGSEVNIISTFILENYVIFNPACIWVKLVDGASVLITCLDIFSL